MYNILCVCFPQVVYLSITAYLAAFCSGELIQYSLNKNDSNVLVFLFFSSDIDPPTQPVSPTVEPLTQQSLPIQHIIIGGMAGRIVLLVIVIVTIIVITTIHVCRQRSMKSECTYSACMHIKVKLVMHFTGFC